MVDKKAGSLLNSRGRVRKVLRQEDVDRLPAGEILIEDSVIGKHLNCRGVGFEERWQFVKELEYDIYCLSPHISGGGTSLPSPKDFAFPGLEKWIRDTGIFTFVVLDGALGWGIKLFGVKEFLLLPVKSPLNFSSFNQRVKEMNLELASYFLNAGVDGVVLADDLAGQGGLMLSPAMLKEYYFPPASLLVDKCRRHSTPVFFHSDGDIKKILPDIIDAGFQGIHCIDRKSNMDVLHLQHEYGKHLCFWGTIDVEDIEQVENDGYMQTLQNSVATAAANKGFILGTSSGIFDGIDLNDLVKLYSKLRAPVD